MRVSCAYTYNNLLREFCLKFNADSEPVDPLWLEYLPSNISKRSPLNKDWTIKSPNYKFVIDHHTAVGVVAFIANVSLSILCLFSKGDLSAAMFDWNCTNHESDSSNLFWSDSVCDTLHYIDLVAGHSLSWYGWQIKIWSVSYPILSNGQITLFFISLCWPAYNSSV